MIHGTTLFSPRTKRGRQRKDATEHQGDEGHGAERERQCSAHQAQQAPVGIYAYVTLVDGEDPTEALRKKLVAWVRHEIGPIASPGVIQWAPGLPKTRSGKIMRRILRKIAANETDGLGDTSTLADPGVVTDLVSGRVG